MRDRSKQLLVINTGKKPSEQTGMPSQSGTTHIIGGGGLSVNMSDYLLKSIWDKVWEIRTDSQGIEYIFGKLPMVTQYGITMYSGDGVDIPSLASGLPFDGRTIWYNPDTQQIEVIGGTGGGSGEGVSNFWDLSGIPSWITNSKPKYSYSEIEGTPDLAKYALASQIPSLSGYATESWVLQKNYATKATTLSGYGITDAYTKTNVDDLLKAYVTLGGSQTITGEKNFTGGLKVNGSPIYYDTEKKYWKLEGDLLVTGGVTMYGSDSSFTPSTIMDAIAVDGTTISKSGGVLKVIGGTSGGGLDITALQNYLTQNSYLNVTEGDGRYLKLSGGTISNNGYALILNRESENPVWIQFRMQNEFVGAIGGENGALRFMDKNSIVNTVWHSGNFTPSNYLPLTGGTLTGHLGINASTANAGISISYNGTTMGSLTTNGSTFEMFNNDGYGITTLGKNLYALYNWNRYTLWHSGNDGSGSGLDADLLDGVQSGAFHQEFRGAIQSADINTYTTRDGGNYVVNFSGYSGMLVHFPCNYMGSVSALDLYVPHYDLKYYGLKARLSVDTSRYTDWREFAFTDSNVASATKLQTARTIWGQSFDGTGNVNGAITFSGITEKQPIIKFPLGEYIDTYGNINIFTTSNVWNVGINDSPIFCVTGAGNVGIGTTNPEHKLHVLGTMRSYYVSTDRVSATANNSAGFSEYSALNYNNAWFANEQAYAVPYNSVQVALGWSNLLEGQGYHTRYTISSIRFGGWGGMSLAVGANDEGTYRGCTLELWGSGTISAGGNLTVSGGITMYSDQRKKTILGNVELSLKDIANAPLIEHYYNSDINKTTHVGSIAQYWAGMNDWFCKLDNEGYYTMEIQNAALASAISIARELDRYETKTDKAIKKLKKRICELEEEVERLKSA